MVERGRCGMNAVIDHGYKPWLWLALKNGTIVSAECEMDIYSHA